jgi:hypothetical protein
MINQTAEIDSKHRAMFQWCSMFCDTRNLAEQRYAASICRSQSVFTGDRSSAVMY